MDTLYSVLIVGLATYAVAKLVSQYDGPFALFAMLRKRISPLRCAACTSVWVAALFSVYYGINFVECCAAIGISLILDWHEL